MAWNGSGNTNGAQPRPAQPTPTKKAPSAIKVVVAGVVVVAVIVAAIYLLLPSGVSSVKDEKVKSPKAIAEAKPVVVTKGEPAKQAKPEKPKTLKERCRERFGDEKLTPARLAVLSCAKETIDLRPIVESNKVAEVRLTRYSNPLHQELVKYVHPGEGCDVPDGITDKEARKLCDGKMEYNFDDPDDVLEEKKAVEGLVDQLKKHLDEGGHAQEFFMKLMERQDQEYAMMQTVKKNITELCKSGDRQLAQDALDKYNKYLKSKGLPSVKATPLMEHLLKKREEVK